MSIMLDEITLEFVGTPIEGPQGPPGTNENKILFSIVENEIPSGSINAENCIFTTQREPVIDSVKVYSDGLRLTQTTDPGNPRDYAVDGKRIILLTPPTTTLIVDYRTKDN